MGNVQKRFTMTVNNNYVLTVPMPFYNDCPVYIKHINSVGKGCGDLVIHLLFEKALLSEAQRSETQHQYYTYFFNDGKKYYLYPDDMLGPELEGVGLKASCSDNFSGRILFIPPVSPLNSQNQNLTLSEESTLSYSIKRLDGAFGRFNTVGYLHFFQSPPSFINFSKKEGSYRPETVGNRIFVSTLKDLASLSADKRSPGRVGTRARISYIEPQFKLYIEENISPCSEVYIGNTVQPEQGLEPLNLQLDYANFKGAGERFSAYIEKKGRLYYLCEIKEKQLGDKRSALYLVDSALLQHTLSWKNKPFEPINISYEKMLTSPERMSCEKYHFIARERGWQFSLFNGEGKQCHIRHPDSEMLKFATPAYLVEPKKMLGEQKSVSKLYSDIAPICEEQAQTVSLIDKNQDKSVSELLPEYIAMLYPSEKPSGDATIIWFDKAGSFESFSEKAGREIGLNDQVLFFCHFGCYAGVDVSQYENLSIHTEPESVEPEVLQERFYEQNWGRTPIPAPHIFFDFSHPEARKWSTTQIHREGKSNKVTSFLMFKAYKSTGVDEVTDGVHLLARFGDPHKRIVKLKVKKT